MPEKPWHQRLLDYLAGLHAGQALESAGADGPKITASIPLSGTGYVMPMVLMFRSGGGMGSLITPGGTSYVTLENEALQFPAGEYQVNWEASPRLGRHTFRLVSVPFRSGILIHPANWPHELEGCVALGYAAGAAPSLIRDASGRGSRDAVMAFEEEMCRDSFILKVS